jgi:hypothetical protein
MDPVHRRTNNMVLGPPPGVSDDECMTVTATLTTEPVCIIATFWKPTPQELELLNSNGLICLHVWGMGHPMVALSAETP